MRAIIIHGTKGSPHGNWFPWLSTELQKLGIETVVPKMPTPENQSLESWLKTVNAQCGNLSSETILIGHSTGAITALRLLEHQSTPVSVTVLVSPPGREIGIAEYDLLNSTFFHSPFNLDKIRSNAGKILYFMGDNDPYVPQGQMLSLAKDLNVNPNIVKNGGHLNAKSGYTSFPLLLDSLSSVI